MSKLWPKLIFRYFKFNLFILVFVLFICCNGVNAHKYIIYADIDNNSIVGPKTVVSIFERRDDCSQEVAVFHVRIFHVRIPYENAKVYEHLNNVSFDDEYPDLCLLLEENKLLKSKIDRLSFEVDEYDDENEEDYNYEQKERLNEINKLEDKVKSIEKEILLYLSKLKLP